MRQWYQTKPEEILKSLDVDQTSGLSTSEVDKRLEHYGPNELTASKKLNPFKLFIGQFKDALVIVLLVAAFVSLALSFVGTQKMLHGEEKRSYYIEQCSVDAESSQTSGLSLSCAAHDPDVNLDTLEDPVVKETESPKESLLIFAIVIAIALVGFFNEYKAEKTVEALKMLVGFKAKVRRNGEVVEVGAEQLVPGDVVVLEAGQKIPADIRLVDVSELSVNESSLTGESLPVSKQNQTYDKDMPLGDRKNMVFAGTYVTNGSALGIVVCTGQATEIGKIADLVNSVETESTPMQQKLDNLGKKLGYFIAAICAVVFVIVFFFVNEGSDKGLVYHLIFAFTAAVALAVAAIPEGLAFVVRISLALGARRMAGKNALVRKLSAVEALGSTDVICSDKTGTLTKGEMTVRKIYINEAVGSVTGSGYAIEGSIDFETRKTPSSLELLLRAGAVCNDASLHDGTILGDPTEGALLVTAEKGGFKLAELARAYPRISTIPFSSERKKMSTVHQIAKGKYWVASKGAVEMVLQDCTQYFDASGKTKKLTDSIKAEIIEQNRQFASEALRVLAFACKEAASAPKGAKEAEKGLIFLGLQAMMDPPREEVIEVIHRVTAEAGMRVIMITGDYAETAKAVASEIGITGDVISGPELDALSQAEFEDRVEHISVYARVNPEHKIRIVQALKKHGHQVAMTGDGVNDAPAIKAADIGIAMGINGTDVAKEAADLILLDDQFLTIVNAIEEGRGIFDNVRKFVNFLISCNIAEVITIVIGIVVFQDLLLTAAQLLFINIVTDGMPAVALGSDPARANVLQAKPKRFQEAIVSTRVWVEISIFGTLMSILLATQYWYNHTHEGRVAAVSAAFTAMVVYELVRLIDIRTDYKIRWFSNPWLSVAIASSFILQIAVLYVPFMASYFEVGPLSRHDWVIMLAGSVALIVVMKALNPILDRMFMSTETSEAVLRGDYPLTASKQS